MLMKLVRPATQFDIAQMVALSEEKRSQYARHHPLFWNKASDSAGKQTAFFEHLLQQSNSIMLVHDMEVQIDGFIIGILSPAPPVYHIGGLNCLIDDFCIIDDELWSTVGRYLLDELSKTALHRGAVQIVVVTGHHDASKRRFLSEMGLSLASEWFTKPINYD